MNPAVGPNNDAKVETLSLRELLWTYVRILGVETTIRARGEWCIGVGNTIDGGGDGGWYSGR